MSTVTEPLTFEPPGPGSWMLDTTHHGTRPLTAYLRPTYERAFGEGLPQMMERYGLPLAGVRTGSVHGLLYFRIVAVGEPEKGGGPPPPFVLKALSRLHPELRRRNRTAAAALAERRWRADVDRWFSSARAASVERNRARQQVDLALLSDVELAAHLEALTAELLESARAAFADHGGDMIPAGLFLAACERWGIDVTDAADLLRGAAPAVRAVEELLAPVAAAIERAGSTPTTMEEVRALGSDVGEAIDAWLLDHGWRLLSSDDLDAPTLAERPDLQLRAVLAASSAPRPVEPPDPSALRSKVPAGGRERFDELLAEARFGLTQRDDSVGVRYNWPAGLVRRALLEVGRRLVDRGSASDAEHALELAPDEVPAALGGDGPDAAALAERRSFRDLVERAAPPVALGPVSAPPPVDAFPRPLATMAAGLLAMISSMEASADASTSTDTAGLRGRSVGTGSYKGRARVVDSPVTALESVGPGDVLVAPFTSPSYDALFPLVGALVTDHGGPLSHAAIMAREFGVPAIVGCGVATATIPDGATVEVDADTGIVRVIG